MEGIGVGLGALGFWMFIAAVVVAGIWGESRKKEAQQETLRRVVESGRDIDLAVLDKVLGASSSRPDRDLKVAGLITVSVAPGLLILAWLLSMIAPQAFYPILGAAALVLCIGIGLLVAARVVEREIREDQGTASDRTLV